MTTKHLFSSLPQQQRINEIDILKGFVISLMILSHTLHFFTKSTFIGDKIILISKLTSFSCFVFCFGFACWKAYVDKAIPPRKKIFLTAAKIYTAYIISGCSYRLFVDKSLTFEESINIFLFIDIPGYSEFLVFYFFIAIIIGLLATKIKAWMQSKKALIITLLIVLTSFLLPSKSDFIPIIGVLFRGVKFPYFPVIPYLPIFIYGMYCAKNNVFPNFRFLKISIATIIVFALLIQVDIFRLKRFPPNPVWLTLCICFVNIFIFTIHKFFKISLENKLIQKLSQNFASIGYNTLFCFLGSNILIFILSNYIQFERYTLIGSLFVWILIMLILHYFHTIQNPKKIVSVNA